RACAAKNAAATGSSSGSISIAGSGAIGSGTSRIVVPREGPAQRRIPEIRFGVALTQRARREPRRANKGGIMDSYVIGASTPPLLDHTIGTALERAAEAWPDQPALISVHQGIRLSYRELLERSDALAAGLAGLGLTRGDRIGIWSPNCAEWTLTQFAAARLGLILVTINPAYRLA